MVVISPQELVFSLPFVCLSGSKQDYTKARPPSQFGGVQHGAKTDPLHFGARLYYITKKWLLIHGSW